MNNDTAEETPRADDAAHAETPAHSSLDAFLGATPRRGRRHLLGVIGVVLAIGAVLMLGMRFLAGTESDYYFATAEVGSFVPRVSEHGTIEGEGDLVIRARISGTVRELPATIDGPVKFGETLVRIDPGAISGMLDADEASLAAASSEVGALQEAANQKTQQLARFEAVWQKSGQRVPSYGEMTRARAEAAEARQALAAAQSRAQSAKSALTTRQKQLGGAHVRAPFDGYLVTQRLRLGQHVQAGAALFRLSRPGAKLMITVPLHGAPGDSLQPGARASVRLDDQPDLELFATLARIEAGPSGRQAVFALEQPPQQVRPGMAATLEIELPERRDVLLVPDGALEFAPDATPDDARARIFLLGSDGEPQRVYVMPGDSDGRRTEIRTSAVKPGDQVIIGWRGSSQRSVD